MNRVLQARSLKFSEHRTNEPSVSKDSKSEVFVHKKSEMNKKGADGGKLRTAFSTNVVAQDKLKTPSIVAALVHREAKEKKKQPRGVWSPLGEIYTTHGMPDLELGEEAKIDNKKVKKVRRAQDNREERQKLEDLMELFKTTKNSLSKVNLFQRPSESDHGLLPSVVENREGGSRESTPRNNRGETLFQSSRADQLTTTQKIAMLGSVSDVRKQRAKKKPAEALEQINHLKEGRGHHLSRWRGGFEETKSAMDRALIQTLVKRAEDRDLVYDNQALMDNALSIASEDTPYSRTSHGGKKQYYTIWERARHKGMDARNAELQKQAMRIKENAQKGRRAVHGSRHGRQSSSKGISPRLMMRSASQPEFTSRPPQPKIRAM